jgi:fatty acid desaturase
MNLLVPLAALLGLEMDAVKERLKRSLFGNAVMIVLALIGTCFLLAAAFFALAAAIGLIYAALVLAAVFLVAAFAVHLSLKAGAARERRAAAEKRRSGEAGAFATTAALTALPVVLRSPALRTLAIPAAAIAAVLLIRGNKHD